MTLGLPFVRTSPLHGTAFDIAKNRSPADPGSLIEAILLAVKCRSNLKRGQARISSSIKIFKEKNIKIVESGYIDLPFWPDTAFSIKEVKKNLLHIKLKPEKELVVKNEDKVLNKINKMMGFIENNKLMRGLFEHIFAHHTYVLGEINE